MSYQRKEVIGNAVLYLGDGGSINGYARLHSLNRRGVQKAWNRICGDLGWQAV